MADQDQHQRIKTRVLIISDTHGVKPTSKIDGDPGTDDEINNSDISRVPTGYREPLPSADLAVHCGDLTKRSSLEEYQNTFSMMRAIPAPLKLVIAGNHDSTMDHEYWTQMWGGTSEEEDEVWKVVNDAKQDGVHYLTEGVYEFRLQNGTHLKVYASQWTPAYGTWGFQYNQHHDFAIPPGIDIAITHGPPRGVLDLATMTKQAVGCHDLFQAIYHARPKIHCFGHIHEGWGSLLASWKEVENTEFPTFTNAIDHDKSRAVQTGKGLKPLPQIHDEKEMEARKETH